MSHPSRLWTVSVVVVVILFGLVFGGWRLGRDVPLKPLSSTAPQPVAIINGVVITSEMVDRELKISRLNVTDPLPPLTGADLERAREEALNQILARQLILQAAGRAGFTLEPDYIKERADLLFGSQGDAALDAALAQAGATRQDMLWWVGEIFTVEVFTTQVIMADAAPEDRQQVFNVWLNDQQANAVIERFGDEQRVSGQALIGQPAPPFTLTSLNGESVSLSDYGGQVVLVNFWATWCSACITEMPDYEQVYQQYRPEFVVLGVNLQESSSHVQQYAAGLGLNFPVLLDSDGRVTNRDYHVTGMPGSFLVDREGKIVYRHVGPMNAETLVEKLAELGL
ncbi:MAG: redoxin domain-containing protein [Anaerolineae bacterium]|nr:redoxin domain-containing protein [Anaerolineae bacterium]